MTSTLQPRIKGLFNSIDYGSPWIGKLLLNISKKLSGITPFQLTPSGVVASGLSFKMATNEMSSVQVLFTLSASIKI